MDAVKIIKGGAAAFFTFLSLWLGSLYIPVLVLCAAMAVDYITGLVSAGYNEGISSYKGIRGIVKKVGYLILAGVGSGVDYVISLAVSSLKFNIPPVFTILIVMWLIINELISIIENLGEIGVPTPKFLKAILEKLRETVEQEGDKRE